MDKPLFQLCGQRRSFTGKVLILALVVLGFAGPILSQQPNIVMIYTDDMGYGDLSCFGATDLQTPNLDSLAQNGVKFTNFYNSSSACCTSRAALLTGSYHQRVSMKMVGPSSTQGLHTNEITMAEMLNGAGYQSAMVGKWHLGHTTNMMPWAQGFDRFYGIPVSHDYNNGGPDYPEGVPTYSKEPGEDFTLDRVINEWNYDEVAQYTQRFTDRAISYIKDRDQDKPLFLYTAYGMPHVTLAVTDEYDGASERGLYGDVMEELDAGVGQIVQALQAEGIADNTLVIFATDNGPWLSYGNHAGDQGGLREGKRTVFDGGVRTPAIMYWPGEIQAGQVVDTPAAIMDIFPTVAALADGDVPTDRVIDGVDIRSLFMEGEGVPYDGDRPIALYDYASRKLNALRSGQWKLVFPHSYETVATAGNDGGRGTYRWVSTSLALYDMENDPGETTNVLADHPDVVTQLTAMADVIRADIGDNATGTPTGSNVRPIGSGVLIQRPAPSGVEPSGDKLVDWNFSVLGAPGTDNSGVGGDVNTTASAQVASVLGSGYANAAAGLSVTNLTDGGSNLLYSEGLPTAAEANLKNWDIDGNGSNENHLEFTLVADLPGTLDIEHISISQWRNGSGAPDGLAFEVSIDGSGFDLYDYILTDSKYGDGLFDVFTFSESINNADSVVMRFAPRKASAGSTGNLHIDGLTVYGSVWNPDLNGDNEINASDLNLLLSSFDADGIGGVPPYNAADLEVLLENYGTTIDSSSSDVPEPGASILAMLSVLFGTLLLRRRGNERK